MKKLVVVLSLLFVLSACDPVEEPLDCESDRYIENGECICVTEHEDEDGNCYIPAPTCEDNHILNEDTNECEEVTPTCVDGEILNEETNLCEPEPLTCVDPFVLEGDTCINPNIVFNFYDRSDEFKFKFDVFDTNNDYLIELDELEAIKVVNLDGLGLTDISFLADFTYIEMLYIDNNDITDLSPLNDLENLEVLTASNNELADVCNFTNTNLVELILSNNNLIDIDCMEGFDNVLLFDASYNAIANVNTVNKFPNAQIINLSHNDIFIISGFAGMPNLEYLDVSHNQIIFSFDFQYLSGSPNMAYIDASNNRLTDITAFNSVPSLQYIYVDNNVLATIFSLRDLENLKVFSAKGQAMQDISVMSGWTSLEEVYLEGQYLSNIEVLLTIPTLTDVDVDGIDLNYDNVLDIIELVSNNVSVVAGLDVGSNGAPLLLSGYDKVYAYEGEITSLTDLGIIAYDVEDGTVENSVISNYPDISSLLIGEYSLELSVTDSEGNESILTIPLVVRERIQMSNLVIFVTFSDYDDYVAPKTYQEYYSMFNGDSFSLEDYFLDVSRDTYKIKSVFTHEDIYFFTSEHPRAYYELQTNDNPLGYVTTNEKHDREHDLIRAIIEEIETNNYIDEDIILDADEDGVIDAITLMFAGDREGWNDLLWPHAFWLDTQDTNGNFTAESPTINGKYVYKYNMQFVGDYNGYESIYLGVIAHEVFHNIGAPDYYHYYQDGHIDPVGGWGLMEYSGYIPNFPIMYSISHYGNFETDEVSVYETGDYLLNRTTLTEDNVIVIDLEKSNEYLYIEYRTRTGDYEDNIPMEGVIVYRVDKDFEGNYDGMYDDNFNSLDEVYIFREVTFNHVIDDAGNSNTAALYHGVNNEMGVGTDVPMFFSDGSEIMITITINGQTADQASLTIEFIQSAE